MHSINHECTCSSNPLIPHVCQVTAIKQETPDVQTYRIQTLDGQKPFSPMPGQLAMISLPDVGEAMFSITAQGEDYIESAIKNAGQLTQAFHEMTPGQQIGVRGPYGNHFPVDDLKGKDLLFIGGGIGLAPVRSLIRYCFANREDFGHIDILYGARSPEDLVFKEDLSLNWPKEKDTTLHVTVDRGNETWEGNVGFVPAYLEELAFSPVGRKVILCGPPIMIKFASQSLMKMGFAKEDVITTLEMRMKCGIGKCGRCNIGSKYVCLDGPVFTLAELDELPDEN
ncbi:FAD/NAD(P)-binding protein [Parasporobacterium paucivorans]|uniref:NAD(P)H-flavin reductase n=1 Tax=Parasporobacterium paucivorans DSM 15970 TaxID=1122934 RepID=A0A1M6DHB9_9FIRM|nr:FAD/NAD(P)-binding protein [Parasporobacterium paucivorans]SHI72757.1 NAD(P)H-flavin reductase [Parasporobacterium paucivorans DSM 15970]